MWSDFDIEMPRQTDGDIKRDTDVAAVRNSINNIIQTIPGTRRMLPEAFSTIWKLLFEPVSETTAKYIGDNILGSLERWEPRIKVNTIYIAANEDQNRYDINVAFTILDTNETDQLLTTLNQL